MHPEQRWMLRYLGSATVLAVVGAAIAVIDPPLDRFATGAVQAASAGWDAVRGLASVSPAAAATTSLTTPSATPTALTTSAASTFVPSSTTDVVIGTPAVCHDQVQPPVPAAPRTLEVDAGAVPSQVGLFRAAKAGMVMYTVESFWPAKPVKIRRVSGGQIWPQIRL